MTEELNFFSKYFSAIAIPTAFPNPCPKGPVVVSIPEPFCTQDVQHRYNQVVGNFLYPQLKYFCNHKDTKESKATLTHVQLIK